MGQGSGCRTHEASGEGRIGPDLAVNLDEPLHQDRQHLLLGEGVFKTVPKEDDEGEALPHLVGTGRGLRGPSAAHLVEHPVLGGIKPLQVLLGSARLMETN